MEIIITTICKDKKFKYIKKTKPYEIKTQIQIADMYRY